MTDKKKYRSRYGQTPLDKKDRIKRENLTARDLEIIRVVGLYRCVSFDDLFSYIVTLKFKRREGVWENYGRKGTRDRLFLLQHSKYLDAPNRQKNLDKVEAGSKPKVYALGDLGADVYHQMTGQRAPKVKWRDKNRTIKYDWIQHEVLIARTMLAFERAASLSNGRFRVVPRYELLAAASPEVRERQRPYTWHIDVAWGKWKIEDVPSTPDCTFAIERAEDKKKALYFLEADNSSEDIVPQTRKALEEKAAIFRKNLAYIATYQEKEHPNRYNNRTGFTVLWVTSAGMGRVHSIANNAYAASNQEYPYNFMITTEGNLNSSRNLHKVLWYFANGEEG